MRKYPIILLNILYLICAQPYTKVTIASFNKDAEHFDTFVQYLGDIKSEDFTGFDKIEYFMFKDRPDEGDFIVYYPINRKQSPIVQGFSRKISVEKGIINQLINSFLRNPHVKNTIDQYGTKYYLTDAGYYNPSDELLIKYNEEQNSIYKFNVPDSIGKKLITESKLMRVEVESDTNDIIIAENKEHFPLKRYFNYDTLYHISDDYQFLNIKVEDRPELLKVHDLLSSDQNVKLFYDKFSLTDLDSGIQKSFTFLTKEETGISKDFLAGSEDSLAIKSVVDPNTGREFGKIVGKEDQISGMYMYGFDQKIKIIDVEDERGSSQTVGVPENFAGKLTVETIEEPDKVETGKISKLMLAGLSMALLYFFTS